MGFLDRFKKKKEQEIESGIQASVSDSSEEKGEATPSTLEKKEDGEGKFVAKKTKSTKEIKKSVRQIPEHLSQVLIRPVVTEKTAGLTAIGQYTFMVDRKANRLQVRQAVRAVYGVLPVEVRIQNIRREPVRFGRRFGKQKAWKKAIVSLPAGQKIEVYEGV
ncbi:MAG: 50S ribosomal protein L23 [Candidatus Uhrbacteria bacterium GW2011_GWF2_41_16]|uniref:Large ribosomal subunit protein uL23 n=2 Tax=Candidatus Uhriibacteriota TaxID=1752732 RepID=A0A0G0XNW4_9BACT|nr:MAG: 50S ribosomal protein L23 [Candidatus Uhrbacteria bacterium GW2011_GWA2_41_10]KKR87520.1 MAG: 50S ribosomal protein L23 [Candidatus Uhrbacteria bacterium GW2011_GWC2_41_11]KKR98500.1 MAG: 50S ribosomal protein L23 [Candidatus Uhrbacteria bacterium GW2011_GWF2_41_16]HBO99964.1 50S ribosomal protein L23 [Candidatus Uhrbacteria bacterium]